jgi:hypothetical protein
MHPGRIDVFGRGASGDLVHGWWEDGAWSFA